MADNYLERRMDDYRSGKLAPKNNTQRRATSARRIFPLENRRVLVTGGASGIGREIVRAFRDQQCRVAIFDNNNAAGSKTAQQTGARFYPCDLADIGALGKMIGSLLEDWGDIDIVINNAAECLFKPLAETDASEFSHTLAVNLTAPFEIARRLAVHRLSLPEDNRRGGRIINIASTRALQSEPSTEAYSASKGGILALTHALTASLAPLVITVNAISPGWIETGDPASLRECDNQFHQSGRVGRPADIARACVFLAMDDADFINGSNLIIDGGVTRKMIYPD